MSLCPFATHRLLPESGTQPRITPRVAILHSAAGKGSLYRFFLERSKLESHFWVDEDGEIEQYIDTHVRADANLKANGYAISIETESTVAATERWTPRQAAAIIRLLEWICDEHPDVTRRQVAAPAGSGIGWHVMFGAPGPWTPVAKSCPGPARVAQARDEIIPAIVAGDPHNPYPKPDPQPKDWFAMATPEELRKIVAEEIDKALSATAKNQVAKDVRSLKRHTVVGATAAEGDPTVPERITSALARIEDATEQGKG